MKDDASPSAEDAAWIALARPTAALHCDAFLGIADSVYVGPSQAIGPETWQHQRVALPPPKLPQRLPGLAAAADLVGQEDALADHYARIIRIAEHHGKTRDIAQPFPYFAVRPGIIADGQSVAAWPWCDNAAETVGILEHLARPGRHPPDTLLLDDQDQCWALRIVGSGDWVWLVEWDAEGPPPPDAAVRIDATSLARQAAAALVRLAGLRAALIRSLGRDILA